LGWVSAIDSKGRTIWIVDAHGYGKRLIVRANENVDSVRTTAKGDTRVRGEFDLESPCTDVRVAEKLRLFSKRKRRLVLTSFVGG
jgi:hypothetical protein